MSGQVRKSAAAIRQNPDRGLRSAPHGAPEEWGRDPAVGLHTQLLVVGYPDQFEPAFKEAILEGAGALVVLPSMLFASHQEHIAALALRHGLPAIFWQRQFAQAGGLMAYGPERRERWQRLADYVDKLLNGAKPADLPVEQPATFELVINLKTAQALGLTIPPSLLFQADEVIR
jgi:putative ABC transport system substrate-binding protein